MTTLTREFPFINAEEHSRELDEVNEDLQEWFQIETGTGCRVIEIESWCSETHLVMSGLEPPRQAAVTELRRVAKFYSDVADHLEACGRDRGEAEA